MKVIIILSGGFANLTRRCELDTRDLPAPAAARVEAALRLWLAAEVEMTAPQARDARTYRFEFDLDDAHHCVAFSEAAKPDEARPVLEILRPVCPNLG